LTGADISYATAALTLLATPFIKPVRGCYKVAGIITLRLN
jgi:hypothetical protein